MQRYKRSKIKITEVINSVEKALLRLDGAYLLSDQFYLGWPTKTNEILFYRRKVRYVVIVLDFIIQTQSKEDIADIDIVFCEIDCDFLS